MQTLQGERYKGASLHTTYTVHRMDGLAELSCVRCIYTASINPGQLAPQLVRRLAELDELLELGCMLLPSTNILITGFTGDVVLAM